MSRTHTSWNKSSSHQYNIVLQDPAPNVLNFINKLGCSFVKCYNIYNNNITMSLF